MDRVHRHPARARRRGPGRLPGRGRADSGRRAGRHLPEAEHRREARAIDPSAGAGALGPRGARWPRRAAPRRAGAGAPDRSRVERASAPAVARDDAPPALRARPGAGRPRRASRPARSPSAVAVALSPLAPIGAARAAEPDPGLAVDAPLVGGGGAATAALVLLAALVPAWRASRTRPHDAQPRSSPAVESPGASRPPAKQRGRCAHGARARSRPDRGARAHDAARRHRRRRRGRRRAHDHRERGSSALHAQAVRPQLGRRDRKRHRPELSQAVRRRACARTGRSRSLRAAPSTRPASEAGRPACSAMESHPRIALAHAGRGPGPGRVERDPARHEDGATLSAAEIGDEVEGRIGDRALAFRVVGRGVLPEVAVAGPARWPSARASR